MAKRELTPEERARRSELARRLHAEGKFGGPQPGSGRPRKQRAAQMVAEAAKERENAQLMIQALRDGLDPEKSSLPTRLQATRDWIKIEKDEDELQMKEEIAFEGLQRDQIARELAERLSKLVESGHLDVGFFDGDPDLPLLEAGEQEAA